MNWNGLTLPDGAYFSDDAVVIYHADCRDILPLLPKVDLVLTDPPYGISQSSNHGASWSGQQIHGDGDTSLRDWMIAALPSTPMAIFGTWRSPRPQCRAILIWDKGPASGMGDLSFPWKNSFEELYTLGDGWQGRRDEGVIKGHIQVTWESLGRCHPNQKPVSLMAYLLSKHSGDLILDPYLGSGSTLRAAKDLGRKAIGIEIEIEEKYCEIAAERMRQSVMSLEASPAKRMAQTVMALEAGS